jgi:hypothetical protein
VAGHRRWHRRRERGDRLGPVHQVASRASAARNDRSPRAFEKPILQERTIAVNVIQLEAHQFFSRASFPLGEVETGIASSSVQQPTVLFELTLTIKEKPFEMAFAQLLPGQPCTGPFEYVDPDVDAYFAERWPVCLCANGTIHLPPDTHSTMLGSCSGSFAGTFQTQ